MRDIGSERRGSTDNRKPSQQQQAAWYRQIFKAFDERGSCPFLCQHKKAELECEQARKKQGEIVAVRSIGQYRSKNEYDGEDDRNLLLQRQLRPPTVTGCRRCRPKLANHDVKYFSYDP